LIVDSATAIEDITSEDKWLTGGYNTCSVLLGGWYTVYSSFIDFTDLLE
jgi:hypothetical protein